MKTKGISGVWGIVALAMGATALQAEVANEIRQIPLDTGLPVQFMYNLGDTGSQQVAAPIEGTGALFELWADGEGADAGTKTLVDSKVIGLYMPKGVFNIDVKDTWIGSVTDQVSGDTVQRPVYRTRADQSYTVEGRVEDLLTDPTAPRAAREVNFIHLLTAATEGGYYVDPENQQELQSLVFTGSDTYTYSGPSMNGYGDDLTLRNGQEKFEMRSYADETVSQRWNVGSAIVKVFPMGSGRFMQLAEDGTQEVFKTSSVLGHADHQVFNDTVRSMFIHYTSMYPESKMYVQIYKGAPSPGTAGDIIPISIVSAVGAVEPQDTKTIFGDNGIEIIDSFLQPFLARGGSGQYTLEIVETDLPANFVNSEGQELGAVVLGTISFSVNRVLKVNGKIGASN